MRGISKNKNARPASRHSRTSLRSTALRYNTIKLVQVCIKVENYTLQVQGVSNVVKKNHLDLAKKTRHTVDSDPFHDINIFW
jgi:hypothetical protein